MRVGNLEYPHRSPSLKHGPVLAAPLLVTVVSLCLTVGTGAVDAATYCVRAGAAGNNDGSDWVNAYTALPDVLDRGATYYVADGTYGGYAFDDPEDGQQYIYIKKAIESDHGTETGWNSSYGDGVALFLMQNGGASGDRFMFQKGYYVFDGQVGGGPGSWKSGHGFKVTGPVDEVFNEWNLFNFGNGWSGDMKTEACHIKHCEITCEGYFTHNSGDTGQGIYQQILMDYGEKNNGPNNFVISHNYIHDVYEPLHSAFAKGWLVEYNWIARNDTYPANTNQGTAWQDFGSDEMIVRYNVFQDIDGTSMIDMKGGVGETFSPHDGWEIYGNVFFYTPTHPTVGCSTCEPPYAGGMGGNGIIGCTTGADVTNMKVYNNTFINVHGAHVGIYFYTPVTTGNVAYNNMWVNCSQTYSPSSWFGGIEAHGYNYFHNNTQTQTGQIIDYQIAATEANPQIGMSDPLINWQNGDFRLKEATEAGLALPAPYNVDLVGSTRGADGIWDRGAYEYIVSDPNAPTYNITSSAGTGGQINPAGTTLVTAGSSRTYTITADNGCHIDDVVVDDSSVGAVSSYTFSNVTSDHTISATFAINTHTIAASAGSGGSITPTGSVQVNEGGAQTFTITADGGHHITNVVVDGSSVGAVSSHTFSNVTSDHTISATFAVNNHTITAAAGLGGSITPAGSVSVDEGANQTFTITPNAGYHVVVVIVDGSSVGAVSSYTFNNLTSDHSISAAFAINTYTLSTTATNGSVTKTPDKASYTHGETVSIAAVPDTDYIFTAWGGDAWGGTNPVILTMDSGKSVTAYFTYASSDEQAPVVTGLSPESDAIQVPTNSLMILHVTDSGTGVDANTVNIQVNDSIVYTGNTTEYDSPSGTCRRTGAKSDYTYVCQPDEPLDLDQTVTVKVNAQDLAGNSMNEYTYSFRTEMWLFGENKWVANNIAGAEGHSSSAVDSLGNIWVVWHGGQPGTRDVFIRKLPLSAVDVPPIRRVPSHEVNSADQCYPALAIDADDKLYVVWQDDRNGDWDIYASTSADGQTWSDARRVGDSNNNETNPAVAVDGSDSRKAYVAWEERAPDYDIYVASSTNEFLTNTVVQVTIDGASQAGPALAVDSQNTAYVFWTDTRSGSIDIYGACSGSGPWANVPVVTGPAGQSDPAVAVEQSGTRLHLLWVDSISGDRDIYYAACDGLPTSPLTGSSIIDDTSGADQLSPAIAASGATEAQLKVFVCWQDARNVTDSGDTDVYFAEVAAATGTNVFVGDDRTNTNQVLPAITTDGSGYPYVLWTDYRSGNPAIYYAGSTHVSATPIESANITAGAGGTVGTELDNMTSADDICVSIPAGACPTDVTVSVSRVTNPPVASSSFPLGYEFSPSGVEFAVPVTIVIPYEASDSMSYSAYWYNPESGTLSQQGITDVEKIQLSPTLWAVRFNTTHFTQFFIGGGSTAVGSGGGGGCSLAPDCECGILDFALPYVVLAVAVAILRLRDRRRARTGRPVV